MILKQLLKTCKLSNLSSITIKTTSVPSNPSTAPTSTTTSTISPNFNLNLQINQNLTNPSTSIHNKQLENINQTLDLNKETLKRSYPIEKSPTLPDLSFGNKNTLLATSPSDSTTFLSLSPGQAKKSKKFKHYEIINEETVITTGGILKSIKNEPALNSPQPGPIVTANTIKNSMNNISNDFINTIPETFAINKQFKDTDLMEKSNNSLGMAMSMLSQPDYLENSDSTDSLSSDISNAMNLPVRTSSTGSVNGSLSKMSSLRPAPTLATGRRSKDTEVVLYIILIIDNYY